MERVLWTGLIDRTSPLCRLNQPILSKIIKEACVVCRERVDVAVHKKTPVFEIEVVNLSDHDTISSGGSDEVPYFGSFSSDEEDG
mmetsp:Transcript_32097/g.69325  ORF Transcript_32097/g.69325 Transcript_32097/m.69325 type:complete len:85 (+) Transcript_32097:433-687(+)